MRVRKESKLLRDDVLESLRFKLILLAVAAVVIVGLDILSVFISIGRYEVTFTNFAANILIISIVASIIFFIDGALRYLILFLGATYAILMIISTVTLLGMFNRLPSTVDFQDFWLGMQHIGYLVAALGAATIALIIFSLSRFIGFKRPTITAVIPFAWTIAILLIFPRVGVVSSVNGETIPTYRGYVQNNRYEYGDATIQEWGMFGSMLADDIKYDYDYLEPGQFADYTSESNSILEGKNINIILFETLDYINWNDTAMPTVMEMANTSMMFNDFYVPANHYGTCRSEFMVLTGKLATPAMQCPWFQPDKFGPVVNDDNIFTNFNDVGYETSYFHSSGSDYYNRDKSIPALGADNVEFFSDDRMTYEMRDHLFADNILNTNYSTNPQLRYWLTYDAHVNYENTIEDVDLYNQLLTLHGGDTEYAEHGTRANFTDQGIDKLLQAYSDDVFVIMSDHSAYYMPEKLEADRPGLEYYNVPMFIYHSSFGEKVNNDTKMTQVDVLPIIYDLMGIENNTIHGVNPLVSDEQFFSTADGETYFQGEELEELNFSYKVKDNWKEYVEAMQKWSTHNYNGWI